MWPLRRNVQYNKRYFFKDILIFVLISHCILLGMIFIWDTGKFHQEKFVVNAQNLQSTIVFMPLKKRVVDTKSLLTTDLKQDASRHIISYDEYKKKVDAGKSKEKLIGIKEQSKIKPTQQNLKALVKKIDHTIIKKSPTLLTSVSEKKVEKKISVKPIVKKQVLKNNAVKANMKDLEKEKKILEIKKNNKEKKEIEVKKNESLIEFKKEEKAELQKTPDSILITAPTDSLDNVEQIHSLLGQKDSIDLEQISFIGSLDLEMLHIKEQIQIEIAKYYKPPVGISKNAVCQLIVVVGCGGKADNVIVKKTSGSLANDMCARAALLKIMFPKEVIGKEIIVELGQ